MEAGGDVAQYLRRSALTKLVQHVNTSMPVVRLRRRSRQNILHCGSCNRSRGRRSMRSE